VVASGTLPKAHAQSDSGLDIDDKFFHSAKSPYEDDDLDRSTRKDPVAVKSNQQQKVDSEVKNEFNSAQPQLLRREEAAAMDQAVVNENKRRDNAILKRLAENTPAVRACVEQSKQKFEGSYIQMAWLISNDGKTLEATIRGTDIQDPEIQKCIYESSLKISFNEAATDHLKKSMAEYTYKFKVKPRQPASVPRKAQRLPAKPRAKVSKN
jgi:hypothetical protein